jgi:hypothetical protein
MVASKAAKGKLRAWSPMPGKASLPPARLLSPSQRADRRVNVYLTPDAGAALAGVQAFLSRQAGDPAGRSGVVAFALRFAFSTLKAAGVVPHADAD